MLAQLIVFLKKSVMVLTFLNNQHPEKTYNFPHFPALFLLDLEYKISYVSHSERR